MIQFVEKQFYNLDHLGPVCRILQAGFLQTGPNSEQQLKNQSESGTPYLAYVTTNGASPFLL